MLDVELYAQAFNLHYRNFNQAHAQHNVKHMQRAIERLIAIVTYVKEHGYTLAGNERDGFVFEKVQ